MALLAGAILLAGGIGLLAWAVLTGTLATSSPPPYATPSALEAGYGP